MTTMTHSLFIISFMADTRFLTESHFWVLQSQTSLKHLQMLAHELTQFIFIRNNKTSKQNLTAHNKTILQKNSTG